VVSTSDFLTRLKQAQSIGAAQFPQKPDKKETRAIPLSEVERALVELWQKYLGIEQVGIHDDFFELGGDSLLAVQLLSKLRETFHTDLPGHSLLHASTIVELAQLIDQTGSLPEHEEQLALPQSLIEIQGGSQSRLPLFLVHPVGGHVYFYRDLARSLGKEQAVYGLSAQGLEGEEEPLTTIEDMAAQYVEAIRVIRPEGPYFLGGASSGGIIAFEMAQQFHALGQRVPLVTLIDSPEISQLSSEEELASDARLLDVLARTLLDAQDMLMLQQIQGGTEEKLRYILEHVRYGYRIPFDTGLDQAYRFFYVFKVHSRALSEYIPKVYPGRILFFRAKETWEYFQLQHPELFWMEMAGEGMEIHLAPGDHISMNFHPHVEVLAQRLRKALDIAERIAR
jgi:thioesterase domain-containing protein/acyl carrier protein